MRINKIFHIGIMAIALAVPPAVQAQAMPQRPQTLQSRASNHRPSTPIIMEPEVEQQIVHPADVHMETSRFTDSDAGDRHRCTTWEIWTVAPQERIWVTRCITGVEKVHTHLGDGIFENSHANRSVLLFDTAYRLRVRHRDNSGDPATEWSNWANRLFRTMPAREMLPLILNDIATVPGPRWLSDGHAVILPAADLPPTLRLELPTSELLLEFRGFDGVTNRIRHRPPLATHDSVRVKVFSGDTGQLLRLPPSSLLFTDSAGIRRIIYLPALRLAPRSIVYFWVTANGSTYHGTEAQPAPDFSRLARGSPLPWTVTQPGYQVVTVANGFKLPVNIAFVPSPAPGPNAPFFYVTELYGTIKVVSHDLTVSNYATDLLNFNPTGSFPGSGEQGLTGIVVDPASGDVYASLLYSRDPSNNSAPHYPKVVRFQSRDGGRTAHTHTVILDMYPAVQGQSHQISHLSIGPDGKLYVHMGDGFNAATAGRVDEFRGKILRLRLNGAPVMDNPFYNAQDGITARDYVYAYGLRNPFGGAWSAAVGSLFIVENGPRTDRFARIVAGRDYLWRGNDSDMLNFALYNWIPAVGPVNIAFIQPETFNGSGFPAEKMDHAFVSESGPTYASGPVANGKRISEFVLDATGTVVDGPLPLIEYNGTGQATIVALAAGPDGLYFSNFYKDFKANSPIDQGANIYRVKVQQRFRSVSITLPVDADTLRTLARELVSSAHVLSTDDLAGQVAFDVTADVCAVLKGASHDDWLPGLRQAERQDRLSFATHNTPVGEAPQLVLTFADSLRTCGQE